MRYALFRQCRGGASQSWIVLLVLAFVCSLVIVMAWHHDRHRRDERIFLWQRAQFNALEVALEIFNNEFGRYPPSEANDAGGLPYCGAMKLAEAMIGQDLLGFHPNSAFWADGLDPNTHLPLYPDAAPSADNLKARKGPFLPVENANAWRLEDIYGQGKTGPFLEDAFVLCDVFERNRPSGKMTGMPILYYRANPAGTTHDVNNPDNPQSIYSYRDNHLLVGLGVPGDPQTVHPLVDPKRFYLNTRNDKPAEPADPYRKDSHLLISAGWDGLYGTADDICNFEWRYRDR